MRLPELFKVIRELQGIYGQDANDCNLILIERNGAAAVFDGPLAGLHGHAALLSPLLAGSLERGLNLAEAMEARGFGRPGRTRAPAPSWRPVDALAVAAGAAFVVAGALWL